MNKTLTLNYIVKPIKFEKINDEFTKCHCYIMALGKNRNYSYFTKEAVQNAIPTLFDIPVVAHIKTKADGTPYVGAHDRQLVVDDDGVQLIDQTCPFGLVPEGSNPTFEDVTESDGTIATYLTADIILWSGRYPIMDAKSNDPSTYFNQSMEIVINSCEPLVEDNNYMNITDFTFSALCLLGRDENDPEYNSEPCFPSARVTPLQYSLNDNFKKEFSLMMNEFKKISTKDGDNKLSENKEEKEFSVGDKLGTADKIDIDNTKDSAKNSDSWKNPGATFLNKCLKASNHEALVKEAYAVVPADVSGDVSINDVGYPHHDIVDGKMIVDVAGVEAAYKRAMQQKLTGAPMDHINKHRKELGLDTKDENKDNTRNKTKFSCTMNQMRDALNNVLPNTTQYDDDGNCIDEVDYWVVDFDDKYVYVERYHWTATDNDHQYGRFSYTFDQNSVTATLTSDFEEMYLMWLTADQKAEIDQQNSNYTKLQTEFEEYKKNYSTPEKDVEELRSYKNQKVAEERQANVDAIFAKSEFEILKDNKEFNDFKANVGDMSLEDIETKCFAIYGKVKAQEKANFSANKPVAKVPVFVKVKVDQTPSVDSAPYGGLFEEYKEK